MGIKKILVTGANGQLGWSLSQLAAAYPSFEFIFADKFLFDLSKPALFESLIQKIAPHIIINTAAYTAVDKAEIEKELAILVNTTAVAELARVAKLLDILLITYSTDYVFNGLAKTPYLTETKREPVNFYGETKANGEALALDINPHILIIRTSWVFSSHGNNFVKTMYQLMKERESLNIVSDQIGRPTYAHDLAKATMQMIISIQEGKSLKGIYHFANQGVTSWFEFAQKIKQNAGLSCELHPITTKQFPTTVIRPAYSVLDTHKMEQELGIEIPHWEESLLDCQKKLGE